MEFAKTLKNYKEYRNSIKMMLIWSGMWPNYKKHPLILKIFLASSMYLFGLIFSFTALYHAAKAHNMAGTTKNIGIFIGAFSINVRVITLN